MSNTQEIDKLVDGKRYFIDRGFTNSGIVTLMSHGSHFCTVKDEADGFIWETMCYRLSELTTEEIKQIDTP